MQSELIIAVGTHTTASDSSSDVLTDASKPDNPEASCREVDEKRVHEERAGGEKKSESTLKDGGIRGWLAVIGSMLIQFTGFGYANSFGVYQDYYGRVYLTSRTSSQISWIGSVQAFLLTSLGIMTGRLFDKGYYYHLIFLGSILMIFSLFMLSLTKPDHFYQVFLAQAFGVGLGSGAMFVPSLALISQHFHSPHKRALAMGIVASGSSLGGMLHPIMLNNLFNGSVGFANGVRASGGLVAGLLLISICITRTKYPPRTDGEERNVVGLRTAAKKFSKDLPYCCVVLAMFLQPIGLIFPLFYIQLDSIEHGIDPNFAFYSITILNGASIVGRLIPGLVVRKCGVANMLIATSGACSILIFGMLGVKTTGGVAAFSVLYGLASGAFVTLQTPMLAMLAEHPAEMGARMGIGFAAQGLGALVGTPVAGALLTARYIWWRPIVFSGIFCASGCIVFTISRIALGHRNQSRSWIL